MMVFIIMCNDGLLVESAFSSMEAVNVFLYNNYNMVINETNRIVETQIGYLKVKPLMIIA